MSDWYARKLAELRGQQPAPSTPPVAPLAPGQLPPHLAPYAAPPPPPQYAAQPAQHGYPTPHGTPAAPPAQPQGQYYSYNAETGQQVADDGHVAMIANSALATGGSQEVKANSTRCPNCGGGNYFTVQGGTVFSKSTGTKVHAMQCADCNYPNIQAGSQGGSLGTARSQGPAKMARQLPQGHRVTVIAEGGQQVTFDAPTRR